MFGEKELPNLDLVWPAVRYLSGYAWTAHTGADCGERLSPASHRRRGDRAAGLRAGAEARIWGATARILAEFTALLDRFDWC
jgi:hypothetical protein